VVSSGRRMMRFLRNKPLRYVTVLATLSATGPGLTGCVTIKKVKTEKVEKSVNVVKEENVRQQFEKTGRVRLDLRTLTRDEAGLAAGSTDTVLEKDKPFQVEITLRSGRVLATSGELLVAQSLEADGPITSLSVQRLRVPIAEADRLLDEYVAAWGIDPAQIQSWKDRRTKAGPYQVFDTNEPNLSIQYLSDSVDRPTTQTIDFILFDKDGFGTK
jgi:hypothetical protein